MKPIRIAIVATAFVTLLPFDGICRQAHEKNVLAYDKRDIISEPSEEDLQIISAKFESSKLAYNDGDFFWKDLEPYYYLNGKSMMDRYSGLSFENFLKMKSEISAPHNEWIDQKNYSRIMESYKRVTVNDVSELIDYTYNSFRAINASLFAADASKIDRETVASVRFVQQALRKLPPVEPGANVYRCDHWPKDGPEKSAAPPAYVLSLFTKTMEGRTFTHESFMSTTRGVYAASRSKFVDACPFLRIIRTKEESRGRDILGFSDQNAYEEEVLFLPRTRLLIKKLEQKTFGQGKTQLILHMEEI